MRQPKYQFGQLVEVELKSDFGKTKIELKQKIQGRVMSITMGSDESDFYYVYHISRDLPGGYHPGEACFYDIREQHMELYIVKDVKDVI